MIETIEKKITINKQERRIAFTRIPAGVAGKIAVRVMRLCRGLLSQDPESLGKLTKNTLLMLGFRMFSELSDEDYDFLLKHLLYAPGIVRIEVDHQLIPATPNIIDDVFAGDIKALFWAMMQSAEVSFGLFSDGLLAE